MKTKTRLIYIVDLERNAVCVVPVNVMQEDSFIRISLCLIDSKDFGTNPSLCEREQQNSNRNECKHKDME